MPLLQGLKENFPLVRIDLVGGDHPVDQRAEAVDLRIRVGTTDTDGLKDYPLAPLERVFCGHRDLLRGTEIPTDPCGLSGLPLILRSQENPEWVFRSHRKTTNYHVINPALRVNSYELCVSAVRSGLGAAVLAKAVIQKDLNDGNITDMLPNWALDPISVSLVIPISRLRRSEVLAVAQFIVSNVQVSTDC